MTTVFIQNNVPSCPVFVKFNTTGNIILAPRENTSITIPQNTTSVTIGAAGCAMCILPPFTKTFKLVSGTRYELTINPITAFCPNSDTTTFLPIGFGNTIPPRPFGISLVNASVRVSTAGRC